MIQISNFIVAQYTRLAQLLFVLHHPSPSTNALRTNQAKVQSAKKPMMNKLRRRNDIYKVYQITDLSADVLDRDEGRRDNFTQIR